MGHSNGVITAPVDPVADIKAVLGESSNDMGALFTSRKINLWAKYRPVSHRNLDYVSDAEREALNYGIIIPYYNLPLTLKDNIEKAGWTLGNLPTGTIYSPYRITDFIGYEHNANSPLIMLPNEQTVFTYKGTTVVNIGVISPIISTRDSISIEKLKAGNVALSDMYFGIILERNASYTILTQSVKGMGTARLSIDFLTVPSGIYNAWLFASSVPVLKMDFYESGVYIGLNQTAACKITFAAAETAREINGRGVINAGATTAVYVLEYTITYANKTNASTTFTYNSITILGDGVQLYYLSLADVSVPANSSKSISGTINNMIPTGYSSYTMRISSEGCESKTVLIATSIH